MTKADGFDDAAAMQALGTAVGKTLRCGGLLFESPQNPAQAGLRGSLLRPPFIAPTSYITHKFRRRGKNKGTDVRLSVSSKGICYAAVQQPVGKLADFLGGSLARPVADKTGLTGMYDYTLFYSTEGTFMDRTIRPDSEGAPYVITAVQEQLGLKLEPEKTRIDFIVIDRADKTPTEN